MPCLYHHDAFIRNNNNFTSDIQRRTIDKSTEVWSGMYHWLWCVKLPPHAKVSQGVHGTWEQLNDDVDGGGMW